jgi:transcription elongation factor GreA
MPDRPALSPAFQDALDKREFDRVEELWLEALERDRIRVDELLEVRRLISQAGRKNLAMTLLDLLVDTLQGRDDPFQTMAALKEQIRLVGKPDTALLGRLQAALTATRAGSPSLDAVVSRYPLTAQKKPVEAIKDIENWLDHDTGTIVEVMGQGVGRVIELNLELDNIKVDLGGRRPVSVPFGAVSRYLRPLPEGDFRRRMVENREELVAFAQDHPGEALVELIKSLGDDVSVSSIKAGLEDVVSEKNWTSWWNRARKHPRILTSGTGSRLRYSVSDSAENATGVLLTDLEQADPRQRLIIAKRLASRGDEASDEANRILATSIATYDDDPGLAWETATALDALPGGHEPAAAAQAKIIATAQPLHLLGGIQDRQARMAALEALRKSRSDSWTTIWGEWLLHESTPAILDTIAAALDRAGATESLDAAIEAVFRNHVQHASQFIWACERMTNPESPEPIRRRMTPSLLEKIPDGLSRREFASLRGRCKALLDGGKVAIRLLLESANEGQAQRFSQRIARLPGVEPQRVSLVEQAAQQAHGSTQPEDEGPLLVATQAAIDAQRAELKQLLEVEIPRTLKGINAAAAEGDLRENFEYHMLRDRQELQSARAAKLQRELREVRTLEPGKADTDRVNIGTVVHFEGETEAVTILGVWDADVDRRVFANGSGLAEALLGRTVGDEVEIEGEIVTIARIEAWNG